MVYNKWAFTDNWEEKRDRNTEVYKQLCSQYKIKRNPRENEDTSNYDLVYRSVGKYGYTEYYIIDNNTNLTTDELLLIFDLGNLCFGGYKEGNKYVVWTD